MLTLYSMILRLAQCKCECTSGSLRKFEVCSAAMCLVKEHQAFAEIVGKGCGYQRCLLVL